MQISINSSSHVVDILIINMPELIQNYLFLTLHATCTYGNNLEA